MTYRILVTGSRDWPNDWMVSRHLDWLALEYLDSKEDADYEDDTQFTLVSGACPTGADAMAENHAASRGWNVERHPADWGLGKRAGYLRNQKMVDLGADVCIGFVWNNSRGATMTLDLAAKAGIKNLRIALP